MGCQANALTTVLAREARIESGQCSDRRWVTGRRVRGGVTVTANKKNIVDSTLLCYVLILPSPETQSNQANSTRLFLSFYMTHCFLKGAARSSTFTCDFLSNWYPTARSPLTNRWGVLWVMICGILTVAQLILVKELGHWGDRGDFGELPIAGVITVTELGLLIIAFTLYILLPPSSVPDTISKFVTTTIGLSCLFGVLSNALFAYGDMTCTVLKDHRDVLPYMHPICYMVLARFLSYMDGIFFAAIQFRSTKMRKNCSLTDKEENSVYNVWNWN
eukprot:sb/3468049/